MMFFMGTSWVELVILSPVNLKTGHSDIIPLKDTKKLIRYPVQYNGKGVTYTFSFYDPNSEYIF